MKRSIGWRVRRVGRLHEIWSGCLGELSHMRRHPMIVLLLVAVTIVYPVFVSSLYARDQVVERPFVVVDLDDSAFSRRLTLLLDATQGLSLIARVDDIETARAMLIAREVDLIVEMPPGLSAELKRGHQATVAAWTYAANLLAYGTALPAVTEVVLDQSTEIAAARLAEVGFGGKGAEVASHPIIPDFRYVFHSNVSYGSFLVPGILLIVLQQVTLLGLAYSAGLRREAEGDSGTAPSLFELLGRGVAQMPLFAGSAGALIAAFVWFGWPMLSAASFAALFAAFVLTLLPMGLFVGTLVKDRYGAFHALMFLSAPLLMISGYAMPASALPQWLRSAANLFPSTPGLLAMQVLSQKSASLTDVSPEFLHLLLLGGGYLSLLWLWPLARWRVSTGSIACDAESATVTKNSSRTPG